MYCFPYTVFVCFSCTTAVSLCNFVPSWAIPCEDRSRLVLSRENIRCLEGYPHFPTATWTRLWNRRQFHSEFQFIFSTEHMEKRNEIQRSIDQKRFAWCCEESLEVTRVCLAMVGKPEKAFDERKLSLFDSGATDHRIRCTSDRPTVVLLGLSRGRKELIETI